MKILIWTAARLMEHLPEFFFHHWELFLSLLILFVLLLVNEWRTSTQQPKKLSPQAAVLLMNQEAMIFDIRPMTAFAKGHLLHATHLEKNDKGTYEAPRSNKSKKLPIILVCQNGLSTQTVGATWIKSGLTDIHILAGGMDAWQDAGFPTVKST